MKKFTLLVVYNNTEDKVLMCRRTKEPYRGLLNFVGGKVEDDEGNLESAYRELNEETGIKKSQILLRHLITTYYAISDIELSAYVGKVSDNICLTEEINSLHWIDEQTNFFDMSQFAGEGNVGHIIEQVKYYKKTNPMLVFAGK